MRVNVWVYKCNRNEQAFARAFGDWDEVFRDSKVKQWGGSRCTGNTVSKHIMNDLMRAGDLVLAYQTNDRALVGVCRLTRIAGERNERILFLKPLHRFDPAISIHGLKEQVPELRSVSAFSNTRFPQTVYEVSPQESRILGRVCGMNLRVDAAEPALPPRMRSNGGPCFGDPVTNRVVERAAVRLVRGWYVSRGWRVRSTEADRCGYDLKCRRGERTEYVEVKGTSGEQPTFNITHTELTQAENEPAFVIGIVTLALSRSPKFMRLSGSELRKRFTFRPLQYHASPLVVEKQ
jgi:predicted RNA-binding protein with PUA-like domain